MYSCSICAMQFVSKVTLHRHNNTVEKCLTVPLQNFACKVDGCTAKFRRRDFLLRHERKKHQLYTTKPKQRADKLIQQSEDTAPEMPAHGTDPIVIKAIITNYSPHEPDPIKFFQSLSPSLHKIFTDGLLIHKKINAEITVRPKLEEHSDDGGNISPIDIKDIKLHSPADVEDIIEVLAGLIEMEISKSQIKEIHQLEVEIREAKILAGGFFPLHPDIAATKAIRNVKNYDSYCFKWAIICGLAVEIKFQTNSNSPFSYKIPSISDDVIHFQGVTLDFSGLSFPMEVSNVRIFENNNPTLSVNVFGVESRGNNCKIIGPLYRTRRERQRHINLLFYENHLKSQCHYAYIKSLTVLLRKQLAPGTFYVEICNTCLKHFASNEELQQHRADPAQCQVVYTL